MGIPIHSDVGRLLLLHLQAKKLRRRELVKWVLVFATLVAIAVVFEAWGIDREQWLRFRAFVLAPLAVLVAVGCFAILRGRKR